MNENFNTLIAGYKNVIDAFRKRGDVQSGKALAWKPSNATEAKFENTPIGFGTGTGTTGWCVSASQALLTDKFFQEFLRLRNAQAKLVSIDIKEQHYGFCFNGSQNKWHTAILVKDDNYYFIIDITCRQFGNNYVGKDIWTLEAWQEAFRSPRCNHTLTDFDGNELGFVPKLNSPKVFNKEFFYSEVFNNLHDYTNLNNEDRSLLTDFFVNQITRINNSLLVRTLNIEDYKYLERVQDTLKGLEYTNYSKTYGMLEFKNKQAAKHWLEHFFSNNCKLDLFVQTYNNLNLACINMGVDINGLNVKSMNPEDPHYLIIEFHNQYGIKTSDFYKNTDLLIPYGTPLEVMLTINGALKSELDSLIEQIGFDEYSISELLNDKIVSLQEDKKLNTSWLIVNSI